MFIPFFARRAALWFITTAILAFSCHTSLAQEDTSKTFPHAVLWRIDKAEQPTSWLLGTLHSSDPRVTTLSSPIKKAFASSEQIYTETAMLGDQVGQEIRQRILLPHNESLRSYIDSASYQKLLQELDARHVPRALSEHLKIWAAALFIILPSQQNNLPVLDLILEKMAKTQGIPHLGLESLAEQFSIFEALPEDKQHALLEDLLRSQDAIKKQIALLIDAYVARDVPTLFALIHKTEIPFTRPEDEAYFDAYFEQKLLVERNIRFVKRLRNPLKARRNFIAIGMAHLPGPQGVVALLEKEGYTLTPVFD